MIDLIKQNLNNIIERIENIYKINKVKSLFDKFGNLEELRKIEEYMDKLKQNILQTLDDLKNYNISILGNIFLKQEIDNDLFNKINSINFNLDEIQSFNTQLENINNVFSQYYDVSYNLIKEEIKQRGEIKDENGFVFINYNEIDPEIFKKLFSARFELLVSIFKDFPDYQLKEIVIEKAQIADKFKDILTDNPKWFLKQKGGEIPNKDKLVEIMEELNKLKNNFIKINVLSSEIILYFLLIRSIRIEGFHYERIDRFISYDDILKFRDTVFNELKIYETDIFKNRINKIIECVLNNMDKLQKDHIDIYKSNNIDLVILSVLIKREKN
jgi:hypothetical protein